MSDYLFEFNSVSSDSPFKTPDLDYISNEPEPDVTVTATRAQVAAAHTAYVRATNEMWALGFAGAGILGEIGGVVGGVLAYIVGDVMDDGVAQQLTENLADSYYLADGEDGVYDGVSDADRAAPYGYYPAPQ